MKNFFKIILLIAVAGGFGFYVGFLNRQTEYVVRQADTNKIIAVTSNYPGINDPSQLSSTPWYITRAAGLSAYILMFLIIVLGSGMTTGYVYKLIDPVEAWSWHQYLSIALGVTLGVHVVSLLVDKFVNLGLSDVLIPFISDYKPVYLSLGILALYILLIIILTSLFLRIKTPKFWRNTHYLTYPLFILSFVHGVFIGTDSKTVAMQMIYVVTGLIFALLLVYRFSIAFAKTR